MTCNVHENRLSFLLGSLQAFFDGEVSFEAERKVKVVFLAEAVSPVCSCYITAGVVAYSCIILTDDKILSSKWRQIT